MDRTAIAGSGLRTKNTLRVESEEFVMTHKWIGTTRALSLLLSLLLAVGLLQAGAVPAAADGDYSFTYAYDCQRQTGYTYPKIGNTFFLYDFDYPLIGYNNRGSSNTGNWTLTYINDYSSGYEYYKTLAAGGTDYSKASQALTGIVSNVASAYGIDASNVKIYELKDGSTHISFGTVCAKGDVVFFIGDNWAANNGGAGYVLSNKKLSGTVNVTITEDATNGVTPSVPAKTHSHTWTAFIDGLGTKAVSAAVSCTDPDCDAPMQVDVSLTASDVTLPGNVFGAKLTVETTENPAVALLSTRAASQSLSGLPEGLEISKPVYKYSATGSGYDPIDPAGFTPKAGYYQASVQIRDVNQNATVADLAVKYTVSDPAVTAATGDNRPIELMILGMAFFCAMAAGAFVLDGRRKVR